MLFFHSSQEAFLNSFDFSLKTGVGKFAIVGDVDTGKTRALRYILETLRQREVQLGGFFQPKEGQTYYIEEVKTAHRQWLAKRISYNKDLEQSFLFNQKAFVWAQEQTLKSFDRSDVIVMDEIGKLEAIGQGHWPLIASLFNKTLEEGGAFAIQKQEKTSTQKEPETSEQQQGKALTQKRAGKDDGKIYLFTVRKEILKTLPPWFLEGLSCLDIESKPL